MLNAKIKNIDNYGNKLLLNNYWERKITCATFIIIIIMIASEVTNNNLFINSNKIFCIFLLILLWGNSPPFVFSHLSN